MESSRIFVRGLPPTFTEEKVRKHFAQFPVTDVKFFPHRRIGYVGYKTPGDAAKAVKYFNKTFINLTRIHAEIARPVSPNVATFHIPKYSPRLTEAQVSDTELPKSRRQQRAEKNSPDGDAYVPLLKENALKRKRTQEELEQDPELTEFLHAYQAPSKTNIWVNGDTQVAGVVAPVRDIVPDDESDNDYQVIAKKSKTTAAEPAQPLVDAPLTIDKGGTVQAEGENTDPKAALKDVTDAVAGDGGPVSDADWLRSRTNRVLDFVEDDEEPTTAAIVHKIDPEGPRTPEAVEEPPATQLPDRKRTDVLLPSEEDKIRDTGRLYLRNLHFDVTQDDLRDHFSKYGALEEVRAHSSHFRYPSYHMMNIQIGTADAFANAVNWESILVDVSLF
jgi:multiple RNA-binding domain-containing protein 1